MVALKAVYLSLDTRHYVTSNNFEVEDLLGDTVVGDTEIFGFEVRHVAAAVVGDADWDDDVIGLGGEPGIALLLLRLHGRRCAYRVALLGRDWLLLRGRRLLGNGGDTERQGAETCGQ